MPQHQTPDVQDISLAEQFIFTCSLLLNNYLIVVASKSRCFRKDVSTQIPTIEAVVCDQEST